MSGRSASEIRSCVVAVGKGNRPSDAVYDMSFPKSCHRLINLGLACVAVPRFTLSAAVSSARVAFTVSTRLLIGV